MLVQARGHLGCYSSGTPTFYTETVSFTVLKVAKDAILAREPWEPSLNTVRVVAGEFGQHSVIYLLICAVDFL